MFKGGVYRMEKAKVKKQALINNERLKDILNKYIEVGKEEELTPYEAIYTAEQYIKIINVVQDSVVKKKKMEAVMGILKAETEKQSSKMTT